MRLRSRAGVRGSCQTRGKSATSAATRAFISGVISAELIERPTTETRCRKPDGWPAPGRIQVQADDVGGLRFEVGGRSRPCSGPAFGGDPDAVGTRDARRRPGVHGVRRGAARIRGLNARPRTGVLYAVHDGGGASRRSPVRREGRLRAVRQGAPAAGRRTDAVEAAVGAVATQLTRDRIENWDPAGQFVVLLLTDVLIFPPIDVVIRAAAWLLMAVVELALLLACANLASFLLVRALDRRKEIAVRLALDASRGSLVRRLLTETTLLGLLASGAGTGFAVWLLDLLATGTSRCRFPWRSIFVSTPASSRSRSASRSWQGPCWAWCRPCRASGRTSPAPSGARVRGRPARAAPVAQRAGRRTAHDLVGAARRDRPLPAQLPAGAVGRPGLRTRADRHPDLPDGHPLHTRRSARLHAAPARPLPGAAGRRGNRRHQSACT